MYKIEEYKYEFVKQLLNLSQLRFLNVHMDSHTLKLMDLTSLKRTPKIGNLIRQLSFPNRTGFILAA